MLIITFLLACLVVGQALTFTVMSINLRALRRALATAKGELMAISDDIKVDVATIAAGVQTALGDITALAAQVATLTNNGTNGISADDATAIKASLDAIVTNLGSLPAPAAPPAAP